MELGPLPSTAARPSEFDAARPSEFDMNDERVGSWSGALLKGTLQKDAVSHKGQSQLRYFALVPPSLMYYESASDSVFKPKGVWCLDDCRGGLLKRAGLSERQAVLLRGKRELVLTAHNKEELRSWNRAIGKAVSASPSRIEELERRNAQLREVHDEVLVELELCRTKLREALASSAAMGAASVDAVRAGAGAGDTLAPHADHDDEVGVAEDLRALEMLAERKRQATIATAATTHTTAPMSGAAGGGGVGGGGDDGGGGLAGGNVGEDERLEPHGPHRLQALVDELRARLHAEVAARRQADILQEAAIQAQIELQDMKDDLALQVKLLRARAASSAQLATRMRAASRASHRLSRWSGGDESGAFEAADASDEDGSDVGSGVGSDVGSGDARGQASDTAARGVTRASRRGLTLDDDGAGVAWERERGAGPLPIDEKKARERVASVRFANAVGGGAKEEGGEEGAEEPGEEEQEAEEVVDEESVRRAEETAERDAEAAALAAAELEKATEERQATPLLVEIERCSEALKQLGARLRGVDAPEARLLYAQMLTSRAKLTHAAEQEAWVRQ